MAGYCLCTLKDGIYAFVATPSHEFLDMYERAGVLNYWALLCDNRSGLLKENIKSVIYVKLVKLGMFPAVKDPSEPSPALTFHAQGLTFEQQKEILMLKLEHEKIKHELEIKKQLELRRIWISMMREVCRVTIAVTESKHWK